MLIAAAGLGARCCADQYEDCSSTKCWPWLECVAYTDADGQQAKTCEIPCGDGVCGEHESPWECPADCADCESLDLDDRDCARLTVGFWADEQRRRTADELNALPFDVVTGRAHFAPALSTLGNTVFVQETGPHETGILQRDNVVACTNYEVDGLAEFQDRHLRCKVFLAGAVVPHGGKLEAFGPRVDGVDPDVRLSSSPRAVNAGDVIYLFYSLPHPQRNLVYVAFSGIEFEPVTYNAILAGFEFDDYPDLPRRVVTHVDTSMITASLPPKPGGWDDGKWPLFAASPFANAHGGLGFIGFDTGSGNVLSRMRGYSPCWPW